MPEKTGKGTSRQKGKRENRYQFREIKKLKAISSLTITAETLKSQRRTAQFCLFYRQECNRSVLKSLQWCLFVQIPEGFPANFTATQTTPPPQPVAHVRFRRPHGRSGSPLHSPQTKSGGHRDTGAWHRDRSRRRFHAWHQGPANPFATERIPDEKRRRKANRPKTLYQQVPCTFVPQGAMHLHTRICRSLRSSCFVGLRHSADAPQRDRVRCRPAGMNDHPSWPLHAERPPHRA